MSKRKKNSKCEGNDWCEAVKEVGADTVTWMNMPKMGGIEVGRRRKKEVKDDGNQEKVK